MSFDIEKRQFVQHRSRPYELMLVEDVYENLATCRWVEDGELHIDTFEVSELEPYVMCVHCVGIDNDDSFPL